MADRTAAELAEDVKYAEAALANVSRADAAGRSAHAVAVKRLAALRVARDEAVMAEREAAVWRDAQRAEQCERWEAERLRRREAVADAGGDIVQFDREWPALQSRLINEQFAAHQNDPRLVRPRF